MLIHRRDGSRLIIPTAAQIHAAILREHDRIREQIAAKIAEVEAGFNRDIDRLQNELDQANLELLRLRELHARARNEKEQIMRLRAQAAFVVAQPSGPLH